MNKQLIISAKLAVFLFGITIYTPAKSIESHVHGESALTVAIENNTLEIEIMSPAINLVGFEHHAHTKKDIIKAQQVTAQLNNPSDLFSIVGGNCVLVNKSIDVSSIIDIEHEKPQLLDKLNKHDEHDNDHPNHQNVSSFYGYHCKKPSTLTTITVNIFSHFPGVNQIAARWLTDNFQGSATLTPAKHAIKLR